MGYTPEAVKPKSEIWQTGKWAASVDAEIAKQVKQPLGPAKRTRCHEWILRLILPSHKSPFKAGPPRSQTRASVIRAGLRLWPCPQG